LSGASRVYVRLNNDNAIAGSVGESAQDSEALSVSAKNSTRSPRAGFEVVFEPYLTASEDEATTGKYTVQLIGSAVILLPYSSLLLALKT